ncbi:MAG: chorismate synthase, partial [Erysipelotrichaceae bacterium]|nr:chorismate synthase [Erysipelotrichaceae bacterium]
KNENVQSKDYDAQRYIARPSHCDYSVYHKYLGYNDHRGSGHFSGRLTAAIVACGAICMQILKLKDIHIVSHILQIGDVCDDQLANCDLAMLKSQKKQLDDDYFAVLNAQAKQKMLYLIEQARMDQDSIGGAIESSVYNLPVGIGEPVFDSLESVLSHAIFSVGGIKAVEFGDGIAMSKMRGSKANDAWRIIDDKIKTSSNHNGGINAGISNGMIVTTKSYIKPTPSIGKLQQTVDFKKGINVDHQINGRHDPCIVHRARIVIDSMIAITLCDMLITRYGQLYFQGAFKSCGA